ncbi:MCE family protein [Mycolicibacterium pyrenivorans]|uniref:MCE family protein n=1 Tax=Mycolicibacterium pyrenivorans TaxID=187102 RepID=UPI0021F27BA7|nr:MCE family protein [Mycolicibacterium pyrenivorans]MCV7150190.1 MCE family protein [Mycolicibacterium pyrenivorans]
MLKYHGSRLVRPGLIGVVLTILVIAVGLQPQMLWSWATAIRYHALFTEAGGLAAGNEVRLSGMNVGLVEDVSLLGGKVIVTFSVDSTVRLGADSTAHIRTATLLGQRVLTLESVGHEALNPSDVIPTSRTSAPYSLTQAVNDFTTNAADTDTQAIGQALDTLSSTLDQIAPRLGPTFDGLSRLSRSLNGRNEVLGELFRNTAATTAVLAERSTQLNSLILNANDLVAVLNDRRETIIELLAGISAVSRQISGIVADNEKVLAPTLEKLNSVTAMLEKNRDNIAKALPGLAKYMVTQGETVSNGYYYNAYVPNMVPAQFLQPFLDYAFGFRRGVDSGQPPDDAGPRAEFPWPRNGIPGGSR